MSLLLYRYSVVYFFLLFTYWPTVCLKDPVSCIIFVQVNWLDFMGMLSS